MLWTTLTKSGGDYPLQGKTIIKNTDSSSVSGEILYEKLPHFDDIGYSIVTENGQFELLLVNNKHYIFTIKKEGYEDFSQQFKIRPREKAYLFVLKENNPFNLDNLIFEEGKADITPYSYDDLDCLADWLKKNPTVNIQLEGHTDFKGNTENNMILSEERLKQVKDYLIKINGIERKRLLIKAFGNTQPLSQGDTEEAKALNSRIEVSIVTSDKTKSITKPDITKLDKTKTDITKLDKTKLDKTKSDKTKLDKTKSDKTKLDKTKTDKTKSDKTKTDKTKSDKTKTDITKLDKTKTDKTKSDKTKTDKTKSDKTKLDKTKTDKTKSDKTKLDKKMITPIPIVL